MRREWTLVLESYRYGLRLVRVRAFVVVYMYRYRVCAVIPNPYGCRLGREPFRVQFHARLPRSRSGKTLGLRARRRALSALLASRRRAHACVPVRRISVRGVHVIRYLSISIRLYIPLALCLSMRYEYSTIVHDEHVSDVYVYAPPLTQSQTLSLSLSLC